MLALGVAIANHCAIVNLLRIQFTLQRSLFSTAGSFGSLARGYGVPGLASMLRSENDDELEVSEFAYQGCALRFGCVPR